MFVQLNSVVIDADNTNREELAAFLAHHGVNVVAQFGSVDGISNLLSSSTPPQIAIINLDPNAADTLKKIGHLPRQHPNVSFFLMSQVLDANLLMEAMHLGVKEFIPLPIAEDKFAAAVERVAQNHGMGKRAKIVHVIPTIGGCGSTTVACNVAASLVKRGKTALIDLDLPITIGGNAISVIGDSTTGGGQPGEVGGETTTPPAGDPGTTTAGLSPAALSVSALAETGSALLPWALAFALMLMAAGAAFLARARTARV